MAGPKASPKASPFGDERERGRNITGDGTHAPLAATTSTAPSATGPSVSVQAEGAKAAAEVLVEDPTATAAAMAGLSAASEACQPRGVFVFGLAATTTTAPSATGPSVFVQAGGAKTAAEELVVDPSATAASVEGHSTAMEVCLPLAAAVPWPPPLAVMLRSAQ